MKSRKGPSFFDVLRTTSAPKAVDGPALETALEPAESATESVAQVESKAPLLVVVPPRRSDPIETSFAPAAPAEAFEPDTRGVRLTYTGAAFMALVAVLLMLGCFYAGVRVGRQPRPVEPPAIAEAPKIVQESQARATEPPTTSPRLYTVKLMEYWARTPAEKREAESNAALLKQALTQGNLKEAKIVGNDDRILLCYGRFADRNSEEARKSLDALRGFKYNSRLIFERADFQSAQ